jgi:outer membrane protein assembly factor BamB
MKRFLLLVLLFLPLTLTAEPAKQSDWLVYRGNPLQNGAVTEALPDQLEILWQFATKDAIEGAPAIHDAVVYIGSEDENLYALDLAKGQEKWHYKAGPIKAPVSYRDGLIYVGDSNGVFHCVDAAKGTFRWKFETAGEIASGANFSGEFILFGSYDESLYCLTKDGKEKWKFKTQGPVNGSPAVIDGKTFVAGCDSSVHVIDTTKGTELSAVDLGGQAAATAALDGDKLYVGTMTNQFHAVDWKQGKILWTFQADKGAQPFFSSAAVSEKLVVAGSRDKRVYAIDRKSGQMAWNFPTRGRIDSSPVIAANRVYVGSLDGSLYVLDLEKGTQLQKIELDGAVTGSPAIADGRLLIGTEKGTLYCLGAKK